MRPDHPLTAFHDYTTNVAIPGFPNTPADITNMTVAAINALLRALDLPVTGALVERQRRLRVHIGIPNVS
jgi:hypothetical protein